MFGLNKYLIIGAAATFILMSAAITVLWYMNESKTAKIATLEIVNAQLTQAIKDKDREIEFSKTIQSLQEKLLIENRSALDDKNKKLDDLENEFSNRKDSNDDAAPIFKDYFKKLRGAK